MLGQFRQTSEAWNSYGTAVFDYSNRGGLVYAGRQTGQARKQRYFHIGILCFAASEYLLWTVGCFWPDTSLTSPTFWCDMLLTLAILGLLPATRKAVAA